VAATVGGNSLAQSRNRDDATTACILAAFKQYNAANLAILQGASPIMTIEATVAQRRLQEQYCLSYARCVVAGIPPSAVAIPLAASFSECLHDEARGADPEK
jgi:hypothetical protein